MFVPSLSWQDVQFYIEMAQKDRFYSPTSSCCCTKPSIALPSMAPPTKNFLRYTSPQLSWQRPLGKLWLFFGVFVFGVIFV
jgi:hypothetical protein